MRDNSSGGSSVTPGPEEDFPSFDNADDPDAWALGLARASSERSSDICARGWLFIGGGRRITT